MTTLTNKIRDERLFNGGMNTDDDPRFLPKGDYLDATNITVNEDGSGGIVVNMKGNSVTYTNPSANAEHLCGWAYYKKHESIILFIYSVDRDSVIIEFDPVTQANTTLIDSTPTDVLDFLNPSSNDYFIKADVLDDWLAWTDNVNPPRMINMDDIGSVTDLATYIDLHKIPPIHPLQLSMDTDDSVVYNNITDGYQFKYRYVYDDFRASVYSAGSDIIISDVITRVDAGSNLVSQENYINILFNSGSANVSFVDISVRKGNTGSWFRVVKIDKAHPENIHPTPPGVLSDNSEYHYRFFNNEGRVAIGEDGAKQYDRVPEKCESLSFLGDNRLALG